MSLESTHVSNFTLRVQAILESFFVAASSKANHPFTQSSLIDVFRERHRNWRTFQSYFSTPGCKFLWVASLLVRLPIFFGPSESVRYLLLMITPHFDTSPTLRISPSRTRVCHHASTWSRVHSVTDFSMLLLITTHDSVPNFSVE